MESLTQSGYMFTRNPLVPDIANPGVDNLGRYELWLGDRKIYTGNMGRALDADIAPIVDSAVDWFPEVISEDAPLVSVLTGIDMSSRLLKVVTFNSEGDETDARSAICIKGGIAKTTLRHFPQPFLDDFIVQRFLRPGNLFFTTRTNSPVMVVKETELSPLYFITPTAQFAVSIIDPDSGYRCDDDVDESGLWAINPTAARKWIFDEEGVIPSRLQITLNGHRCLDLIIEQAKAARERYLMKFRNSFGFFERIELVGSAVFQLSDSDGETKYQTFNPAMQDFESRLERRQLPLTVSIPTGPKRPEELRFLLDALASEEVWLEGLNNDYLTPGPVRVIPSCREMKFPRRFREPVSLTLDFELCETDASVAPTDTLDAPRKFTYPYEHLFD